MLRVYELTRSNSAVSFIVLLVTIPNIVLGALAGVVVDRSEKKVVMFFSHFLRVFAVLAFLISPETLGWIYFLVFTASVITQFFYPAEAATIPQFVADKKLLLTANSLFTLTFLTSVVLGNVLAGPFLKFFGASFTFILIASAFLLASFFTARLPGKSIWVWLSENIHGEFFSHFSLNGRQKYARLLSDFLHGLDYIYKNKVVLRAISVNAVSQVMVGILGSVTPGFADRILRLPVADVSLVIMAPAVLGMVLGSFLVGQLFRQVPRENLTASGSLILPLFLLLFSLVDVFSHFFQIPTLPTAVLLLALLGGANAFLVVPANTIIQEHTPERLRSRVFGVLGTVAGLGGIVPIALAGIFADIVGVRLVMIFASLFLLAFSFYNRNGRL